VLKQKLDKISLNGADYKTLLGTAAAICGCFVDMLEQTEPYAINTISGLREAAEELSFAAEDLCEEING
jgi:hypothetical protein